MSATPARSPRASRLVGGHEKAARITPTDGGWSRPAGTTARGGQSRVSERPRRRPGPRSRRSFRSVRDPASRDALATEVTVSGRSLSRTRPYGALPHRVDARPGGDRPSARRRISTFDLGPGSGSINSLYLSGALPIRSLYTRRRVRHIRWTPETFAREGDPYGAASTPRRHGGLPALTRQAARSAEHDCCPGDDEGRIGLREPRGEVRHRQPGPNARHHHDAACPPPPPGPASPERGVPGGTTPATAPITRHGSSQSES